jgi:DNA-binding transcriptional MerR regulator/methylmalonyl-CoA mutase cobalamin-binding subunit
MGRYRIGAAAKLSGLSTHALRAWERRYEVVTPERTPSGGRLYSDNDIARLRLLKQLIDSGHSIGRLAHLPTDELRSLMAAHHDSRAPVGARLEAQAVIDGYLASIKLLALDAAERLLASAATVLEPRALLYDIVIPLLQRVGDDWQRGNLCVLHEHAVSAMLRNHLGGLLRAFNPTVDARVAVAATPAGELHEFGATAAALLAAMYGWRVVYLGPNLPAEELARAVAIARADVLLLSIVALAPDQAREQLRAIRRRLPDDTTLLVGGGGIKRLTELPPGVQAVPNLRELESWLKV